MTVEVAAMCEPDDDEPFDFDMVEPLPGLTFFYGDEDYLRRLDEAEVARIRARKAEIAAAKAAQRERTAS
jgi:hypothetical protein